MRTLERWQVRSWWPKLDFSTGKNAAPVIPTPDHVLHRQDAAGACSSAARHRAAPMICTSFRNAGGHRKHCKFKALRRTYRSPERQSITVAAKDHQMALADARRIERAETREQERSTQPAPPRRFRNYQVMNEPAATVVTAKYSAHERGFLHGNETRTRVPREKLFNGLGFIGCAESDPWSGFPQVLRGTVVGYGEGADRGLHVSVAASAPESVPYRPSTLAQNLIYQRSPMRPNLRSDA